MKLLLDHLGVAVRSIEKSLSFWEGALGATLAGTEEVPSEAVRTAFLPVGEAKVELLEPTSPDSAVGRFLDRRGEGLHHVCFRVDDIEAALARLRSRGIEPVGEAPRPGAGGCRVAFLHPRSTGGLLIELSEAPAEKR